MQQDLRTSLGRFWTNVIIAHNDRKNDTVFYWISFCLFLLTLFCSVIGSLTITLAESNWALVAIPIFIFLVGASFHWHQCFAARYWSVVPHDPVNNVHINLENDSENVIDSY